MLEISKYNFLLEAVDDITLPSYKGSTFHGGVGHALMKISPIWYKYFFEPGKSENKDWPKPFVVLPPLDELSRYPKGHQFQCDITLFGEATQHYAILQSAVEYLGLQMGLGYENGKYKIIDIQQKQPCNIITTADTKYSNLIIHLSTRLRLKTNNKLQRQPPSFALILTRLIGRLKTLETAYAGTQSNYYDLLQQAENIKIGNSSVKWDDWDRFSGRQKEWMKFGGLMGNIEYIGDIQPFIEILELGEWLHIGNKTSFGLGKYEIQIE